MVNHFFAFGEKLVQEVHAVSVLVEEFGFPRLRLAFLDQIQDHDRRAVSRKKVVKVPCGGSEKWIDDADWAPGKRADADAGVWGYATLRTLDGRPWGHVILFLHPVDRDTSAILYNQSHREDQQGGRNPTHLNVAGISRIWASGCLVTRIPRLRIVERRRKSL